jgi:Flp pilus assembly protein TadG
MTKKKKKRVRGQALVELAILAPWIFFLFVSAVDTGFCLVAAISVQNAARAAALDISSSSVSVSTSAAQTAACTVVTNELQSLPNHVLFQTGCAAAPLQVMTQTGTQMVVTVNYQTISLIPVPGLFSGPYTITRSATFPMRSN